MSRLTKVALIAISLSMFTAMGAKAHGGATGVVKERMMMMESLGKSLKELKDMMRGKTTYEPERVREIARKMSDHGGDTMTKLFPKDSLDKPSEALPSIWKQWDKFKASANQLTAYANALEKSAENERGGAVSGGMASAQGMMSANTMMGQGMMGKGGMMTNMPGRPDPEQLASMPPDAAFMQITQTCGSCHEGFRKPKK